jgi:hypothetical protein
MRNSDRPDRSRSEVKSARQRLRAWGVVALSTSCVAIPLTAPAGAVLRARRGAGPACPRRCLGGEIAWPRGCIDAMGIDAFDTRARREVPHDARRRA